MTNNWYIKKDNTDFTVKYYNGKGLSHITGSKQNQNKWEQTMNNTENPYQIYNELYEILNEFIHKRIELLSKENQIQIIDLLTKRFKFEYPENENE